MKRFFFFLLLIAALVFGAVMVQNHESPQQTCDRIAGFIRRLVQPPAPAPRPAPTPLALQMPPSATPGRAAQNANKPPMIPDLAWKPRSDWIDVQKDVKPRAIGDGKTDDTAALQAALDQIESGTTIYLPPGTYRITKTLDFNQNRPLGISIIGHGRSTTIRWDGQEGGRMLWLHGGAVHMARYIGISWDGAGKAAVGIDHDSKTFETEVLHQHEAFRNMTDAGIRIGYKTPTDEPRNASAEMEYFNCLFENCRRGVAFLAFNDYDNTFDGCEFRRCDIGIEDSHGNVYARNCHFEGSTDTDLSIASEHSSSVRRCTSVGSNRFIDLKNWIVSLTIQDCHVAGWKAADGAIKLDGAPVIMMDCSFGDSVHGGAPVELGNEEQRLILSGNTVANNGSLLKSGRKPYVVKLPEGQRGGVIPSASQRFLKDTVVLPEKIFDAKQDFGAKGDGVADDTSAVQQTIDAARHHGKNALAYFPTGKYAVSQTLKIAGADYTVGGSGFCARFTWKGKPGGTVVSVEDPDHVVLENINIGNHDVGKMDNEIGIHQVGSEKASSMTYNNVAVFGMYQKNSEKKGLQLDDLAAGSTVHLRHLQGNLGLKDAAQATVLVDTSYEGQVVVEGKSKKRDGFLGFQMRLMTLTAMPLTVRDNHSVTMSDLYIEQADNCILLQGGENDPSGRVVIQGAKMQSKAGPITIDGYGGSIFLGHDQYYTHPSPVAIAQKGKKPLDLFLAANFFYHTLPKIESEGTMRTFLIANAQRGTDSVNDDILHKELKKEDAVKAAEALDEVRRLGELDVRINYPEIPGGSPKKADKPAF